MIITNILFKSNVTKVNDMTDTGLRVTGFAARSMQTATKMNRSFFPKGLQLSIDLSIFIY